MSYPFSSSLVLSELLVKFAQFIPEEQRQDGVRTESKIRGSQAFVESRQALLLQCLGKAVSESFIKLPLAQMIHRLVVEPCAHHIKRRHSQHHHHAADHASTQRHQPAVLWKHLQVNDKLLGGGEGAELSGRPHADPRHSGTGAPPQPQNAVLPVDGRQSVDHPLVFVLMADCDRGGRLTLQMSLHQVYGAAHHGSHHSGHRSGYGGFDRADPAVGVDVTGGLDDGVRAEPDSIHEELVEESGHQSFLQTGQSVHFADGVESVKHVAVVDLVGAAALQLSLQLHPRLDHLQRVGEQTGPAGRRSAQHEVHDEHRPEDRCGLQAC